MLFYKILDKQGLRFAKGGKVKRYIVHKNSGYDGEVVGSSDTFRGASMIQKRLEKKGVFDDVDSYGIKDTEDYFYRRKDNKYAKGGKIMKTYDDFDRDYERFTNYVLDRIDLDERRKIREDWNRESRRDMLTKDEKQWENYLLKRVNEKSYAKGGEIDKKDNNNMLLGGLAGILFGIFTIK